MDLLWQMFYTIYCLRAKKYTAYDAISAVLAIQILFFTLDIALLWGLVVGVKQPPHVYSRFDWLWDHNSLFKVSIVYSVIGLYEILFYVLFGRDRRLERILLYTRHKYGRKCKKSLLWFVFIPVPLFGILLFIGCAKNNGYF